MTTMERQCDRVRYFVAGSLVIGLVGCSAAVEPESRPLGTSPLGTSPLGTSPLGTAPIVAVTSEGAGFVHTANNSKFRLGSGAKPQFEFGMSKLVGSEGVFGTIPETGWVLAIPNARAPSTIAQPLTRDPEVHNRVVLDYFKGAGLPADQVGAVTAHAIVKGGGSGALPDGLPNGEFAGYTSVVSRVVGGLLVPDSFAWARFDIDGDVVEEEVYWPKVPANVIQEAKALAAVVADPAQYSAFASKLPSNLTNGQVSIRHSSGSDRASFECAASYDMQQLGEMGSVHHFDSRAIEFKMASAAVPEVTPGVQTKLQKMLKASP